MSATANDVAMAGGGYDGLTTVAYLTRTGPSVIALEKTQLSAVRS